MVLVLGDEALAAHLGRDSDRLGVSSSTLALFQAGAKRKELATAAVASLHRSPGIALGDVVGANVATCLVAHGVIAWIAPLPFRTGVTCTPARPLSWCGRSPVRMGRGG